MSCFLGIDTSNYTTSAALYDEGTGEMLSRKQLLPVKEGACGLRQSDAVFHHVQQLPQVLGEVLRQLPEPPQGVGVSARPRDVQGSYMPCFTVGVSMAKVLSESWKVPLYSFSHQNGHIAAALYSAGKLSLTKQRFLAFHVSGGTTEALLVQPDPDTVFSVTLAAKTLDLNAGQLIDRVGVMMGLPFPSGRSLEALARRGQAHQPVRPTLKGADCCLSGVENVCRRAYEGGMSREDTAALCLCYIEKTIFSMCQTLLRETGPLPVLFAGGVMSDRLMREGLAALGEVYFAEPEFSSDNAAGTAVLCSLFRQRSAE